MMYRNTEEFHHSETIIRSQVSQLIESLQYKSAEILISLFLSSLESSQFLSLSQKQTATCEFTEKLGDIAYSQAAVTEDEARLGLKESLCLSSMKDHISALQQLELIPIKLRNSKINVQLGYVYKLMKAHTQAISVYKEILREFPTSFETIEALIELGESPNDIISIINEANRNTELLFQNNTWMNEFITSLANKRNGEYDKLESKHTMLSQQFPNNRYLLSCKGIAAVELEHYDQAYAIYKSIRRCDSTIIDNMDRFAIMLHAKADSVELNNLANDILSVSCSSPIGWLVVALFCDSKGNSDKAMSFVDKAISLDSKYSLSYFMKGKLSMAQGNSKQASVAFFQANTLRKELITLTGLVESNLSLGRGKEAYEAAKEAVTLMPKSSLTYTLLGKVLSKNEKLLSECIKAFSKAILLNPNNQQAASNMSEVLASMEKNDDAISCLKAIISKSASNSFKLRMQLAKLLTSTGKYQEAIMEVHAAASLSPKDVEEATQEIDKIEVLMQGENMNIQQTVHSGDNSLEDSEEKEESYDEDNQLDDEDVTIDTSTTITRRFQSAESILASGDPMMHGFTIDGSQDDDDDDDEYMNNSDFDDMDADGRLNGVDRELFTD